PAAPKVNVPMPATFHNQLAGASDNAPEQWWKGFGDPLLDRLLDRASRANLDIRRAAARLAEAEAVRRGSRSALLPDIGASTSVTDLRGGFSQGVIKVPSSGGAGGGNLVTPFETTTISGSFNMRWEIDVFRGLAKSLKAAGGDAMAAAEN